MRRRKSAKLPIAVHAFGYGGYPVTGGGWPSYYIEEMVGHSQCCQALVSSMVLEGVFERFPRHAGSADRSRRRLAAVADVAAGQAWAAAAVAKLRI